MSNTIHTQGSYSAVLESLQGLPQEMTGDSLIAKDTLNKCAVKLLGLIRDAFVVKSMGGTDEAGERWAPLQPSTINARHRKRVGRTTSRSKRRKGESSQSYDSARRRAKNIIKAGRGKANNYNKYASRDSAILHDSGKLLESLTPNSSSPDQVLEVSNGMFSVGTRRVGAAAHHNGTSKLPQRRLWPSPNNFPDRWWDTITKGLQDGAVELIKEVIRGAM